MQEEDSNLVKARGTLVWIAALLMAFGAVWWIERETGRALIDKTAAPASVASGSVSAPAPAPTPRPALTLSTDLPQAPAPRALTEQEKRWARAAWAYFERNTDPRTGLASSVAGFPSATMWDTASALLALLAAHELGLVERKAFDERLGRTLASLGRMPLHGDALPNKSYDIRTLAMTDYANQPAPAGIGWSAIDVGRLLVPLNVIAWHHPRHTDAARQVIARWRTDGLVREGQLFGMQADPGIASQSVQEGRLGYEQYAARTFALMGLDVDAASDWHRHLALVPVQGVPLCTDNRDPQRFGAQNFVVSEPHVLDGLEFGWTRWGRECAWRLYRAQEARHQATGILTAVSEDHVDAAPHFVYNAAFAAGRPWVTVTEKGEAAPALRSLSVKAAFAWHALLRTDYTARLVDKVASLHDPAQGWMAGLYEEGGKPNRALTANTNGVVLESLAYIVRGHALHYR